VNTLHKGDDDDDDDNNNNNNNNNHLCSAIFKESLPVNIALYSSPTFGAAFWFCFPFTLYENCAVPDA
jgi:hypothetical protein